jgi:hypothetical protein
MQRRFFCLTDVARAAERPYSTVYQWARHRQIPPPTEVPWTGGRRKYYDEQAFQEVVRLIREAAE